MQKYVRETADIMYFHKYNFIDCSCKWGKPVVQYVLFIRGRCEMDILKIVLYIVFVIDCIALSAIILLQEGDRKSVV